MDDTEHRRRSVRRWLCTCGRRFPCGPYLYRRDQATREFHPGGTAGAKMVGWNVRRVGAR